MEVFEAIKTRRSIRNVTDEPVSDEQAQKLLEAVMWAPSWANVQTHEVIMVRDPETKQKICDVMGKTPGVKTVANAPIVFVMAAKLGVSGSYNGKAVTNKEEWYMFDQGIATQNLCLAAHEMGLGSVVIGIFDAVKVAEILGLPDGYAVTVLVPVGHPAKVPSAPKRREPEEFSHNERF